MRQHRGRAPKKFGVTIDKEKASRLIYTGESLEEAVRDCIQVNAKDDMKTNLMPM